MPQVESREELDFLRDLEQRRGEPIGYRTFSTFYADSDGNVRDFGVFFYHCKDRFWYEDFEHEPTFLGIKLRPRKSEEKYEKFESSFSPLDVVSIRKVVKSDEDLYVLGQIKDFYKILLDKTDELNKGFTVGYILKDKVILDTRHVCFLPGTHRL